MFTFIFSFSREFGMDWDLFFLFFSFLLASSSLFGWDSKSGLAMARARQGKANMELHAVYYLLFLIPLLLS